MDQSDSLDQLNVQGQNQPQTSSGGEEPIANYSQKIVYKDPKSGIELCEFMLAGEGILNPDKLVQIGFDNQGHIHKCGGSFAYKQHGRDEEFRLMVDAGEFSITPYSRVLRRIQDLVAVDGITMELGSPLEVTRITSPSEREGSKTTWSLSSLDCMRKELPMVISDRPTSSGLKTIPSACATSTQLSTSTAPQEWEGGCSPQYISPNMETPID